MSEETKPEKPKYEIFAIKAKDQALSVIDEKTWNKELVFAFQTMRNNSAIWKKVADENPQSITNAIVNIANVGTTLNPALQLAFLIPRKMRVNGQDVMSACLDHSYRGLCQIATGAGAVLDMDADCVYEGDYFKYIRGLTPTLEHIPFSMRDDIEPGQVQKKDRSTFKFVYATAILPFGNVTHTKFIVLDKEEVEKIRLSSQAPESPMWKNHYGEGARKTAIKKLYKLLPQTERMSTAVAQLNEFEGIDFEAEKKNRKESTIMSAFTDAEVVETPVTTCEHCEPSEGKHQPACPEHPDNQPT